MVKLIETLLLKGSYPYPVAKHTWELKKTSRFFAFLLFFLFSSSAFGQQMVLSDTTYKLHYKISQSTVTNQYVKSFLTHYAQVSNIGDPYFYVDLSATVTTTAINSNRSQITCIVVKDSVRGNSNINGFDLSSSLFPTHFSCTVHFLKNNKISKVNISNKLKNNQTTIASIQEDSVISLNKVLLKNIQIDFDNVWLLEINNHLDAIKVYEKLDSLILRWKDDLNKINLENTEMIPLLDYDMDDLIRRVQAVNNLDVISRLKLMNHDPNKFGAKLSEINFQVSQKQVVLQEYLMNIDRQFIINARKYKENGNILQSIYYYNKAIEYHSFNIVALSELARLYYEIGNLPEASLLINRIFKTTYPDDYTNRQCIDLGKMVYRNIVNKGNDMYVAQKFSEAYSIYEIATIFCDSNSVEICNGDHIRGIKNSKNGIYQSYFTVIKKALLNNHFQIAENYIKEAKNYQLQNIKEIPTDVELQKLVDMLVSKLVESSKKLIDTKQFVKALTKLEKADSVGHLYRENFALANLDSYRQSAAQGGFDEKMKASNEYALQLNQYLAEKSLEQALDFLAYYKNYIKDTSEIKTVTKNIKTIEFNNALKTGNSLFEQNLNQNALDKYLFAKQLKNQYSIVNDTNIDSLVLRLSRPLLLDYLSKTRQNVWGNDFELATEWFAKAESLSKNINLDNDSSIVLELIKTEKFLNEELCNYQNNKYSTYSNAYLRNKNNKNYIVASQYADSLQSLSAMNNQCIKIVTISADEIKELKQIGNYQELIRDARYLANIEKTEEALVKFYHADSLYDGFENNKNRINRDSIASIFILCNNNKTLITACEWMIEQDKIRDAMSLLLLYKQKGGSASISKKSQKKIGQALILLDKMKYPSISKKELLKMYPVSGWWFYTFRSNYLGNPLFSL